MALAARLDGLRDLASYQGALVVYTAVGLALRLPLFYYLGFYRSFWRYASVGELFIIVRGVAVATVLLAVPVIVELFWPSLGSPWYGLPRSVPFLDGLLTLSAVGGIRFLVRAGRTWTTSAPPTRRTAQEARPDCRPPAKPAT